MSHRVEWLRREESGRQHNSMHATALTLPVELGMRTWQVEGVRLRIKALLENLGLLPAQSCLCPCLPLHKPEIWPEPSPVLCSGTLSHSFTPNLFTEKPCWASAIGQTPYSASRIQQRRREVVSVPRELRN